MSTVASWVHMVSGLIIAPPDPGAGDVPPGAVGEKVLLILRWVAYLATAACVGGVLVTGGRMALAWRRGDHAEIGHLGQVLFGCLLIGSAASIVGALL